MIDVAFDMETSDPDDIFTLCLLSTHIHVNLVSVTVTPGTKHQIGLVKHILKLLDKNIPVGSRKPEHDKDCVSKFHYNWLGKIGPKDPDDLAVNILEQAINNYPNLNIICGAALSNIGAVLDRDIYINKIFIQGGFAGDNIVSSENILGKFRDMITCPTYNLNGDKNAALKVLESSKINKRWFISKNVCHGVKYDKDLHLFVKENMKGNNGLELIYNGMSNYLLYNSEGKAFHDPLAACCMINQSVCKFKDVELYLEKGKWGSRISDVPNCKISVQVNLNKFKNVLVGIE